MKLFLLTIFVTFQLYAETPKVDSLLNIEEQVDDELRRQKLDERHPVPTPAPSALSWEADPDNNMQTECYAEGKCATILKPKKFVRTDGLEVR